VVNAFFGAFSADLDKQTDARTGELTKRIGAYARAKAAREQAERIEKERLQREEARRLEQEAEDKRKAAEESQRQADEAAAKIRAAETPEAREEAFAEMRQAETHADILRDQAEEISGSAAQADRRADTQGRAADANIGKLSRVSSAGATSSVTETWGHAIADAEALLKSLGPLGPHISNTEISAALSRAVTVHERAGTVETLAIPGVNIFRDTRAHQSFAPAAPDQETTMADDAPSTALTIQHPAPCARRSKTSMPVFSPTASSTTAASPR
jgi:hypothetical protein